MTRHWGCFAVLLLGLALVGCRKPAAVETPTVVPEDNDAKLSDRIDIDLADWYKRSRKELVKISAEWTETLRTQLAAVQKNPAMVDLLPRLLPPLSLPVFHQATFSAEAGFSLPPYLKPGQKDGAVALHLARFGDHEAALKLAPDEMRSALSAYKTEKNYPVEWTHLTTTVLLSSQVKLSLGDKDGASQLVHLHRQLTTVLDRKAAEGPLGSALLSMGKHALQEAAVAWRKPKRNKAALADEIDQALKSWARVPTPAPALPFASSSAEVSAFFAVPARGKVVIAHTPASVARVVDLVGLPLPREGMQVVAAFLDDKAQLVEWQFAYRAKVDTLYPSCRHLAYRLVETGYTARDEVKSANLARQSIQGSNLVAEIVRSDRSLALGGLIRLVPEESATQPVASRSFREFGPVSLDRGFEANRLALAPGLNGSLVTVKESEALKKVAQVLDTPTPAMVVLHRDKEHDLLNTLELAWPVTENEHALDRLLPSLWDDYGPGKLEDIEDQTSAYLSFTWQDRTTRVQLRLAYDERGPILTARDAQDASAAKARLQSAQARDEKERQARVDAEKAEVRLVRSPLQFNGLSLANLQLGQARASAEAALPRGQAYRRKELPNGISVVILTKPDEKAPYWARQILVRFDQGKVAEIRLRYQPGNVKPARGDALLDRLSDTRSGAPETLSARHAGLWSDLGNARKPMELRWRDDRTIRTYQQDDSGMEVTWLDRKPGGSLEPTPWQFVSQGVPGCQLGDKKDDVEKTRKAPVTQADGADVYRLPASSPYEIAMVWYERGRVVRILALHRDHPGSQPKEVAAALTAIWGKHVDTLGFVRRQEGAHGDVLGAYYWHDDRTRVRISIQNTEQGTRMMTEWRTWPVQADRTVARPDGR